MKKPADLNRPVLEVDFADGKGELVRLDLATGAIDWSVELDTMPLGASHRSPTISCSRRSSTDDVVAYSLEDGSEVWSARLPAGTNSPLAIAGDRLVTAAGFPQGAGQKPALVVFRLDGERVTPPAPAAGDDERRRATDARRWPPRGDAVEVGVVEGALRFDPSELSAEAGEVTFRFTTPRPTPHDFVIEQDGERIDGTDAHLQRQRERHGRARAR